MKHRDDWQGFNSPYGFIRLILLVDWDPVGVLGYPEAMDEYDRYAPTLYDMLKQGASVPEIAAYLHQIESERIGVRGNARMPLTAVAAKLRSVFSTVQQYQDMVSRNPVAF